MFAVTLGLIIGRITHLGIAGGVAFVFGSLFGLLPLLPVFWVTYLFLETLGLVGILLAIFPDGLGSTHGGYTVNGTPIPNGIPPWAAKADAAESKTSV